MIRRNSSEIFWISHGQKEKDGAFNKNMHFREDILLTGDPIAVLGRGTNEADPGAVDQFAGYREGPPVCLRMRGSNKVPLVICDDVSAPS